MRVVVLTNIYPPHHYGGYEQACHAVVERWRAGGHDVRVVTGDHLVEGVSAEDPAWVTRGLRFYWEDHELVRPRAPTRLRWERANRRIWGGVLDEARPEVVSIWNHGVMSYQLLAEVERRGIPMVLVVADNWLVWGPGQDLWTRMFDDRSALRRLVGRVVGAVTDLPTSYPSLTAGTTALFASSWLEQQALDRSRFDLPHRAIVPWGVDTSLFPILDEVPSRAPTGRLLFVGRIDERKGVLTAVRALAALPEGTTLEILGPSAGPARAKLDALVADLDLADRVRIHQVAPHEVAARYHEADVALFPSEWEEPFGLVGVEAMACGVPLVATGTGGSGDYLRHEDNALLVPPGDAAAITAAVSRLLGDARLRATLVTNGFRTARGLTLETMSDELERRHLDAIGDRPPR